jgi:hypothetical protein
MEHIAPGSATGDMQKILLLFGVELGIIIGAGIGYGLVAVPVVAMTLALLNAMAALVLVSLWTIGVFD